MDNTSGFYKFENSILLFAPNGVTGPGYDLQIATKDQYTYPVEEWSWFNSEEEANLFFNILPSDEEVQVDDLFIAASNISA